MTRYNWHRKHQDHLKRGDLANLMADLEECRVRVRIAANKPLVKAWQDRMRQIEKAIAELEEKNGSKCP